MNREIKFRVWNTETEEMGPIFELKPGTTTSIRDIYILMQYTGLKDKNGKEIYDGDIVRLHCGGFDVNIVTATIEWDEYKFIPHIHDKEIKVKGGSSDGKMRSMGEVHSWSGMHSCFSFDGYIEIIGNIYENPNLLTK